MTALPKTRKPARGAGRLATHELQRLSSHARGVGASRIHVAWRREGERLFREAERTKLARDWRAVAIHFMGVSERIDARLQ
jgi:hypothetical protein